MALVNPYCTVEQVRAELSDDGMKLNPDLIEKAINASSRAVDRWTGRRFWQDPTVVARTYRPADPCTARVDDISTATGLVVKTDTGGDGSFATTWSAADYQLEPLNAAADGGAYAWWDLVAVGGLRFPCASGRRPWLQVTARWGWSQVPDQVVEATVLKSVALFKRKEAPFGVAAFGDFGAVRITRSDPDVMDMLRPFQRVLVA